MQKLKTLFSPRDMTVGTPWKRILEFAMPMLVGNIAQQLYASTDSAVVGQYVGDNALASVGSTGPIMMFMIALFIGISTGAGILVSQAFGAKNRQLLSTAIGNCITLTAIVSLIIMAIGVPLSPHLLRALNTPEEIIDGAISYLQIYFYGIVGFTYYNVLSGVLRGLGDSFSALGFLVLTSILNIVLDLWFVIGFQLGVPGVAWATVIAQSVSAVLCYHKLSRMQQTFDINTGTMKLKMHTVREILRLGMPSGFTQAIFSMAMILVQRLQNSFGPDVVATAIISMRVDGFAMMPNFSFGMAMTTYTGQNIGAGKVERVQKGATQGALLAVSFATVMTLAVLIFGRSIMSLFTRTESIIELGMRFIRILSLGFIAMAVIQTMSGVMRGAGDAMTPMWISLITSVLLRVPLSYLLVAWTKTPETPLGRPESIYYAMLATWLAGAAINYFAFKYGRWRKRARARIAAMQENKALDAATELAEANQL
ncbi:MAG: MATE family efflux transporter [Clostridiales bacterium]|nr:MATE family efflux transporter [Clostridiales bacterium]